MADSFANAIAARNFSTQWQRRAFSAGQSARAADRCARMCVSSRRLQQHRPRDFARANAASPNASLRDPSNEIRAHLEANLDRAVSLAELARIADMSPFTVQRTFKQKMGVSPLQYQRSLRAGRLRGALKQNGRVTDAIYEAGFGSSSRAYEGAQLGMTPTRFAKGGEGERIGWCAARSPFGWVIVGSTRTRALLAVSGWDCGGGRGESARGVPCRRSCSAIPRFHGLSTRRCKACAKARISLRIADCPVHSTCEGRCFNFACGRHCGRFRAGRRVATARLRARWANRMQRGPWLVPAR